MWICWIQSLSNCKTCYQMLCPGLIVQGVCWLFTPRREIRMLWACRFERLLLDSSLFYSSKSFGGDAPAQAMCCMNSIGHTWNFQTNNLVHFRLSTVSFNPRQLIGRPPPTYTLVTGDLNLVLQNWSKSEVHSPDLKRPIPSSHPPAHTHIMSRLALPIILHPRWQQQQPSPPLCMYPTFETKFKG